MAARAIHYLSPKAKFPFVAVNCGRLPDTLLEDELFGHERGAFTDAHTQRHGLIAHAENGTLFLDEVEALTSKAQVALLRVLQEKKYRAVGSSIEKEADVRVIAATNAPIEEMVQAGSFRADLYYRLSVFIVTLPPLRDRKEDILPLANHFLKKHTLPDREVLRLSREASCALAACDWPGNVRELENAIVRGIHLCQSDTIEVEHLMMPPGHSNLHESLAVSPAEGHSFKEIKKKLIERFERDYLMSLMKEHNGNVSHAALAAGKERRDLGKLLKKYQIDPKLFRSEGHDS